jgi:anaerobic magnesium-protoporphyrin IX monomethyl ester cyclase
MLGYPGETEADIEETIHHLKDSDPDHFTITVAYPIRGTELYEEVEALQTASLDWSTTTDRQIDFKRTYPRKYYDHAVRRVISEVGYHKSKSRPASSAAIKLKLKSVSAKIAMWWYRSGLVLNAK